MHPIFKSIKNIIVVGIIWISLILLFTTIFDKFSTTSFENSLIFVAPIMILELILGLSTWYICNGTELKFKNIGNIFVKHGIAASVSIFIWVYSSIVYGEFLDQQLVTILWANNSDFLIPILSSLAIIFYMFFCTVHYLVISLEKSRIAEKEAMTSRLIASKAELKALQSTIHPHFLFNSLNAIGALTRTAPEKAHIVSIKLSDFLRYSLKYDNYDLVTVESEIDHIKNYLEVEQIRMGERLKIKYEINDNVSNILIPPFLLLPLIENTVKHGIQNLIEGGEIGISIKRNEKFLFINVQNPYDSELKVSKGENHGLKNLRDRLNFRYGKEFNLKIDKMNNIFKVKIYLPLRGGSN